MPEQDIHVVEGQEVLDRPDSREALELLARGEIDIQIETAKRFPRSIKRFINEATEMACLDEQTATECFYALPRDKKTIEGPSARLAEIVASAWGNCRAGARVVGEDAQFVTAQGVFFDLERNMAITYEVKRRIVDKHGRRYSADMIGVTANAACSIALRNAVLKGVPKAYWKRVYEEARRAAIGDVRTIAARREEMVAYFGKMGVSVERVLAVVGKEALEDVGVDELLTLKGLATAIKEGETTIEEAFPMQTTPPGGDGDNKSAAQSLLEKLKNQRQNGQPAASKNADAAAEQAKAAETETEPVDPRPTQEEPQETIQVDTEAEPAKPKRRKVASSEPAAHERLAIIYSEMHGLTLDEATAELDAHCQSLYGKPLAELSLSQINAVHAQIKTGRVQTKG